MRIFWLVLLMAACTAAVALAQRGRSGWIETEVVKCCIPARAMDAFPTCQEMGKLLCDQSGGKQVKDCDECE